MTGIPKVPAKLPMEQRRLYEAIKEVIETGEGQRGDPRMRNLKIKDLIDLGMVKLRPGQSYNNLRHGGVTHLQPIGVQPELDLTPPPAPANLVVNGAITNMLLQWDAPTRYNHSLTEVWRNSADNLATAVKIGTSPSFMYADAVDPGQTYYYWVRFVSVADVAGPYNQTAGTPGTTGQDPQALLDALQDSISESQLAASLNARITAIDDPLTGSVAAEAAARAQALIAEAQARADDLAAEAVARASDIAVETTARVSGLATEAQARVDGLAAEALARATALDAEAQARAGDIASEAQSRTDGLAAEALARTTAITTEQTARAAAIATEVADRNSAITAAVAAEATARGAAIASESTTRVSAEEAIASDVTALQATVNSPTTGVVATSNALTDLSGRVTTAEGGVSANSGEITTLKNTVNNPTTGVAATSTALGALDSRVDTAEGSISTQSSQITALEGTVNNPTTGVAATSTALSALDTRVDATEGSISTQSSQITALDNAINDANANVASNSGAITALDSRVTITEGEITAQSSDVTALRNSLGRATGPGTNLLDLTAWVEGHDFGQGSPVGLVDTAPWVFNGFASENAIVAGVDPHGRPALLWQAISDATSGADGGWRLTFATPAPHKYRLAVWAKQHTFDGRLYLGVAGTADSGTTYGMDGVTVNANPYLLSGVDLPELDKWYLLVGLLHEPGYNGGDLDVTGIYDPDTGAAVAGYSTYEYINGGATQTFRCLHYYSTADALAAEWCWPRVDVVDGTEPSIADLLAGVTGLADQARVESTTVAALDSRVSSAEGTISSQASDITQLQTDVTNAQDTASGAATAATALDSRVTLTEDAITAQASDISTLQSSLSDLTIGAFDANATYAINNLFRYSDVTYRVISTQTPPNATPPNASYYEVATDYTSLPDAVSANGAAIAALDTRVTSAEGTITSQSSDITALENTVNHATTGVNATSAALGALDSRVTMAEGSITTQSGQITTLENGLSTTQANADANAGAISALDSRITSAEGEITGQSTELTGLSAAVATGARGAFTEVFDGDDPLAGWEWYNGGGEITLVADSQTGKQSLQVGNNSGDDEAWLIHKNLIPFDPNALYRMAVAVKRTLGTGRLYAGFAGVRADGVTLCNTTGLLAYGKQHYCAASNAAPGVAFTEYVGYLGGHGEPNGFGSVGASITEPAIVHADVRYLRPLILLNYSDEPGTMIVDSVAVDRISGVAGTALAVESLDVRVTTAEGSIVSQSSAITTLQNDVIAAQGAATANASAIGALDSRVEATESGLTSLASDTTLLNSAITIGPDGALVGAGGGQVTAAGIGAETPAGALAAAQAAAAQATPLTLIAYGTGVMEVLGLQARKLDGGSVWNASVRSAESYTGGCFVAARIGSASKNIMLALSDDPEANDSYPNLYSLYIKSTNVMQAYLSSGGSDLFGAYVVGDTVAITYDGANVRWFHNGVVLKTLAAPPGLKLYLDCPFHTVGGKLEALQFGPLSSNDYADIGGSKPPSDADKTATSAAFTGLESRVETAEGAITTQSSDITSLSAEIGSLGSTDGVNLIRGERGVEYSDTGAGWAKTWLYNTAIASLGLAEGDILSFSAETKNEGSKTTALRVEWRDSGSAVRIDITGFGTTPEWQRLLLEGMVIPAGATHVSAGVDNSSATGTGYARSPVLNHGHKSITGADTASSTALSALDSRVTSAEGTITSQASDITALENTVNHGTTGVAATSSALGTLTSRVTTAEGVITTNSSDITALENTVNNPTTGVGATSSALDTLESAVNHGTTGLSATASRVGSLESTINTPTTGVAAKLNNVETIVTTPTTGLVSKVGALEATVNTPGTGLSAKVTTVETAIADPSSGLGALASKTTQLATESAAGNSGFDVFRAWHFDTAGDAEGFTLSGATWTVSGGAITITSTGNDPILRSPVGLAIDGGIYNRVRGRVRRTAGTSWQGTIYYGTPAPPGHGESGLYYKSIPLPAGYTNGEWFEFDADMSALTAGGTDWVDNTIDKLRFDFGANSTTHVEVDWIAVGRQGPGGNSAALEVHASSIDGLSAQYTVKMDVNGRVAGYGLASGPTSPDDPANFSEFIVNADRFAILSPAANQTTGKLQFGVEGGVTVMDGASIKTATITSAKIQSLNADKINAGTINAAIAMNALTFNGGSMDIGAGKFTVDSFGNVNAKAITIRDGAGNILMSSGAGMPYSTVTGGPPANADNTASNTAAAIAGQGAFATLSQINAGNASTYIAAAAIGNAQIGNAAITNAKIGSAAVETLHIGDNQVTVPTSSYTSGGITISTTSDTVVQSVSFTSVGAKVLVVATLVVTSAASETFGNTITIKIKRNGTTLYDFSFSPYGKNIGDEGGTIMVSQDYPQAISISDQPPAGVVTYTLTATAAGPNDQNCNRRALATIETKR